MSDTQAQPIKKSNAVAYRISCGELAARAKVERTTAWRWLQGRNTRSNEALEDALRQIVSERVAVLS